MAARIPVTVTSARLLSDDSVADSLVCCWAPAEPAAASQPNKAPPIVRDARRRPGNMNRALLVRITGCSFVCCRYTTGPRDYRVPPLGELACLWPGDPSLSARAKSGSLLHTYSWA